MLAETIIISVLSTVIVFLLGTIIYQYFKHKQLTTKFVEATLENINLGDKFMKMKDSQSPGDTEGFIKFLSQSRDYAFNYIEEVQRDIVLLLEAMESKNEEKIHDSYIKLMGHLPKEQIND